MSSNALDEIDEIMKMARLFRWYLLLSCLLSEEELEGVLKRHGFSQTLIELAKLFRRKRCWKQYAGKRCWKWK